MVTGVILEARVPRSAAGLAVAVPLNGTPGDSWRLTNSIPDFASR
ncbi:hypothetical protein GCM10017567_67470 [Amycolatopsis bullii]|uniref:Uncharacterized protein n=1 Tax=Amycolatopsis bullii TaxID=941987 RepID=A0ABQ3KM53_9PSEU|nr:hypothetical protein GCM10017567_67470 [Amycolatopsis bullii]